MPYSLETKFKITRITKNNINELFADYEIALKIYEDYTPRIIRIHTNEITSWIHKSYKDSFFDLFVFILYLNDTVVGLVMLNYITQHKVVVIKYITLLDSLKSNSMFFPYMGMIRSYISKQELDVNSYLIEVIDNIKDLNKKQANREMAFFKRLMHTTGFKRIDAEYILPPLGLNRPESSAIASVYILNYLQNKHKENSNKVYKYEYLNMVKIIHNCYIKWYQKFLNSNDIIKYSAILVDMYEKIQNEIKNNQIDIEDVYYDEYIDYLNVHIHSDSAVDTSGYFYCKPINK